MMTRLGRKVIRGLLILALAFPLSQCSQKQDQVVRKLKPEEAAKLEAAYGMWPDSKKRPAILEQQKIPEDRLESLGDISLRSRDYDSSLLNYAKILKEDPERYDIRYKVGVILFLRGQLEQAKQELALVLLNRPEMLEAHEALGLVYLQEKNYQQAISEFQTVLATEPRRAKTRHLLGLAFLEAGQTARAITELRQAAVLEPGQIPTQVALGKAYIQQKDYQQAVTILQRAQAAAPNNPKVNYQLGMALASLKRYPEAMEAFMRAGDEAQAYNNIGVHYYMEGRFEEAAKCFQRALELRPVFYDEAKVNLQRALEKLQEVRHDDS